MKNLSLKPSVFRSLGVFVCLGLGSLNAYSADESNSDDAPPMRDTRIPIYQTLKPTWGFELAVSLNAFGGKVLRPEQGTTPTYAVTILNEYQPQFVQDYGVLGIGPSIGIYPIVGPAITSNALAIWSVGGQVRYQARYFRQQPIVPVAGYAFDYMRYAFNSGLSGGLIASGPVVGLWLFLNFLEPSAAANLYVNNGISRSYLIFEMRSMSGTDANINYSGFSNYFGLRLEM